MSRTDLDRQLANLRSDLATLSSLIDMLLDRDLSSIATGDPYDARIAQSREDDVDRASEAIEENAMNMLTLQQPVLAADLRLIVGALVVSQRLQRVGHGAQGTAGLAIDLAALDGPFEPPPRALLDLGQMGRQMLHDAVHAFVTTDVALAARIIASDSAADDVYQALKKELFQRLGEPGDDPAVVPSINRRLTYWLWIAHKLERVADHAVVIAHRARQIG
jgi:phosphate transport system protein